MSLYIPIYTVKFLLRRDLDMTHYMALDSVVRDDGSVKKYDLYAVCNHYGTLEEGHCKLLR